MKCLTYSKDFEGIRASKKYCSWFCSVNKFKKVCPKCKKEFMGRRNQVMCSHGCQDKGLLVGEHNAKYVNNPTHRLKQTRAIRAVFDANLKSQPCEICGVSPYLTNMHAHHQDYDKPLEVNWLCSSCHRKVHLGTIKLKELSYAS